jgi:hypothetical protein
MDWDQTTISFKVTSCSQTISNGEAYPPYQFRMSASTSDTEDIVIGADGDRWFRDIPIWMSLVRGKPEKPLARGIGVLAYHPEMPARDDIEGFDEFVSGWFWLPESSYDEIWTQAREPHYDQCVLELEFAPVEPAGGTVRWNTEKNKVASILSAGVRFDRQTRRLVRPNVMPPPKKRSFFSLR